MKLSEYYDRRAAGQGVPSPDTVKAAITAHLREVADTIAFDVKKEGVSGYQNLQQGETFLNFYHQNMGEFKGFMAFISDHQGIYDKAKTLYNWRYLEPYTDILFRLKVPLSGKQRLLEVSGMFELAWLNLNDEETCRFILTHFSQCLKGKENDVLFLIHRLKQYWDGKTLMASSPWCLYELLCRYFYCRHFNEFRFE